MKPKTLKTDNQNRVSIGGMLLEDLVSQYKTPLYVIDQETLKSNSFSYTNALDQHYPNYTIAYASKAGLTIGLAKLLKSYGLGLDVVSGGELFTALKAGLDSETIYFHGNNKSLAELEYAIKNNIRIVIDNAQEITNIIKICKDNNLKAKTLVRLKPEIEAHTHDYIKTGQINSKFGIDKHNLLTQIKRLIDEPDITFLGIHSHIGSQILDILPFEDLVSIMVNHIIKIKNEFNVSVQELNLGGGVGVQYTKKDDPPDIPLLLESLTAKLIQQCDENGLLKPKLILEPGRSIIATAGITLYTVGAIKVIPETNKTYIFVDGGMADNIRPAMYQAEYTFAVANKDENMSKKTYTIAGKFCESSDILGKNIVLPEVNIGDILIVYGTGAYNYSMSSNYNRFCKPAMLGIDKGQANILVRRESYEDLIRNDQ